MKFLKLHNSNDNSVVIVNYELITCVDTANDQGKRCSMIYIDSDSIGDFTVNETPEKIYSMISEIENKNSTSNT